MYEKRCMLVFRSQVSAIALGVFAGDKNDGIAARGCTCLVMQNFLERQVLRT